jgi:hypothetical protein
MEQARGQAHQVTYAAGTDVHPMYALLRLCGDQAQLVRLCKLVHRVGWQKCNTFLALHAVVSRQFRPGAYVGSPGSIHEDMFGYLSASMKGLRLCTQGSQTVGSA